jgi:hypothetical protein
MFLTDRQLLHVYVMYMLDGYILTIILLHEITLSFHYDYSPLAELVEANGPLPSTGSGSGFKKFLGLSYKSLHISEPSFLVAW